jgi:3-deoxy-D-manno-octulosonic-acid transferase
MGGSFTKSIGCHNILEPASFGIPVLIGPFYKDFKEVIEQYINNAAIIRTPNITLEHLVSLLEESLNNYENTKKIGERGKNIVDMNKGASERTVKKILDIL